MKIELENDKVIIYIKKEEINDLNFNKVDELEEYFKNLIIKLKNLYDISITGFYNIKVFIDKIYGMVLQLEKEEIDYYDDNQIEMRIIKEDVRFLYEVNDPFKIKKTKLIKRKDKYYLMILENILYKDFLNVLENSKIVYNNTENIIKCGKIVNTFSNFVL